MADDNGLPQQIQSVERGIVFLRQEHLTMLHGLHLEILSLQKRCTELTTELKVKHQGRSQFDIQDHEELLELHCRDLENCLHEQEYSIGELRKELTHKGALVGALRANLKEKERHFLEELKRRSHGSTILNTELQKQTETAAYLSFQLHAARQKLQLQRMQQRQGFLARVHSQGAHYEPEQSYPSPLMPSGASPSSPVVKPKRKNTRASSRVERARECVPMERVLGPAEPMAMPDPALFLNPRRHRARPRHAAAPTPPPPGQGKEQESEGGGEGPEESQKEATKAIVSSAVAAPAAETKAD
uniref:Si:dkey-54n8.4 n=1 Tax=Neogobius melanostomus TaxID=47308 RepID=A0A8C6SFC1_9GOBI